MRKPTRKEIRRIKKKTPKETAVMVAIQAMIGEFGDQVLNLSKQYAEKSEIDLKAEINQLNDNAVKSKEKLAYYHLNLAREIYKERFNEEVPLRGLEVDVKGVVTYTSTDNVSGNV